MTSVDDTEIDLGLDMSFASQRKNSSSTGANANPKADMMNFVGSYTLAELVWSPQTGVNIKFAEKEPCFMWDAGPSETRLLDTQNEEHVASLATYHVNDAVIKSSICTGSQNQGAANGVTSPVNESGSGSESRSPLKVEPIMQCEPQEHIETNNIEMNGVNIEKDDCCSDPFLKNAQVAIFEDEDAEKHDAKSSGSMESCRSANFLTQRKRKCIFKQQLVPGSKRIKKQADEYETKTDNSFMNWISNMLKGIKSHNIHDQRINVGNETRCLERKETGFHNVFQSLFSPETVTRIENKSIGSSVLAKRCSQESHCHMEAKGKKAASLVKEVRLYKAVSKEAPKGMFDTIRRLRLSRTDIHKWMNSKLPVSQLDGFFLRLRVAKWEQEAGGSRYYVACITGSQWETPSKDLKQPIRVKVGNVECFVESQHVSNCDFIEDELIAWWQKISKNQRIQVFKELKSKLAMRRTLGM